MGKKITKAVSKANNKSGKSVVIDVKTEMKAVKARKARVVSFTVVTVNKRRSFTPVNKRAKAFGDIAGAAKLSTKHLKAIKALGFRVVETGTMAVISL